MVGTSDFASVPEPLSAVLDAESADKSAQRYVMYGWPTLVYPGESSYISLAPLFVVSGEPDRDEGGSWRIAATTEPELNPSLSALGYFDRAAADEVMDRHSDGLPFGDPSSFVLLAKSVADRLGVEFRSGPDPSSLDKRLRAQQGLHNSAVMIRATPQYLGDTIRELRDLGKRDDWQETAARLLIPHSHPPSGGSLTERRRRPGVGTVSAMPSNPSQEEALTRLVRDLLTVITGPPGTGKTQLVVNAAASLAVQRESILIASVNNAAVNVASERATEEVCQGLIIRTGNRAIRETVSEQVQEAVQWAQRVEPRPNIAKARGLYEKATAERSRFLDQLDKLDRLDSELLPLSEILSEARRRAQAVSDTLWGGPPADNIPRVAVTDERRARRLSRATYFRATRAEKRIRAKFNLADDAPLSLLADYPQRVADMTEAERDLQEGLSRRATLEQAVGEVTARMADLDSRIEDAGKRLAAAVAATGLRKARNQLSQSPPARRQAFRRYVGQALNAIKAWSCTSLAVSGSFPLKAGLFDLVVIDEASQCTLATVLPLLYRAKRVAVCGDPRQLQPIVNVSKRRLDAIAAEVGYQPQDISDRGLHHGASAYRALEIAYGRPPILLREHYRSHPTIARWFNRVFYGGRLVVLTDPAEGPAHGITWMDVDGTAERGGSRSWVNRAEAQAVVNCLRTLFRSPNPPTIGVITPFRGQADLIRNLIAPLAHRSVREASQFVAGTAHALQGNERDLIVFSPVVAPGMGEHAQQWVERERYLINVAASRARNRLVVVGHPGVAALGNPTLASLRSGHVGGTNSVQPAASRAGLDIFDSTAEAFAPRRSPPRRSQPHLKTQLRRLRTGLRCRNGRTQTQHRGRR